MHDCAAENLRADLARTAACITEAAQPRCPSGVVSSSQRKDRIEFGVDSPATEPRSSALPSDASLDCARAMAAGSCVRVISLLTTADGAWTSSMSCWPRR